MLITCLMFNVLGLLHGMSQAILADESELNCGPHCLYVAAGGLGNDVGQFETFLMKFGEPGIEGHSLGKIEAIAQELGLKTYGVKTNADILAMRPRGFACIAWINGKHFVLIQDVIEDQVSIIDPPRSYQIPIATFMTQWDGTALLLSHEPILTDEEVIQRFGGTRRWLQWGLSGGAIACLVAAILKWRRSRAS